jgi:ABC-type nickel/cobalt efflux system permease component RcnA
MPSRLGEYLVSVTKLWGQEISGPVLAGVSIVLAIVVQSISDMPTAMLVTRWGAWATGGSSVLLMFVAQYKLWTTERDRRELEEAKNLRPDLKGEAAGFQPVGIRGAGVNGDEFWVMTEFKFRLSVCNYRDVTTNITGVRLDGSLLDPPVIFGGCGVQDDGHPELPQGIRRELEVHSEATLDGVHTKEIAEVDLAELKIYVVDGFGVSHLIQPRRGESLLVP